MSRKALYRVAVRGIAKDKLPGKLGLTNKEFRSVSPWAPGLKCLNNDEASLTWLVLRGALWVGKKLCAAGLAISSECVRCGDWEESIEHAFFHCDVVQPLCRLIEGYMVRVLDGKFFVLEASSVCSNVVPSISRDQHYVLLCLLGIMRMVVWTTRQKEFHAGEKFSSLQLVSFFRHQLKVKIRAERARLSSWNFGKRWVKISRLVRVRGADLEWLLDAT